MAFWALNLAERSGRPDLLMLNQAGVGNVLTVNGETDYGLSVRRGEVVRFYLTNTSSSRTYNLSFSGAPLKVVASDVSRFEREERVPSVVMAVTTTTAIRPAIRPYSMAVAPESSRRKREKMPDMR